MKRRSDWARHATVSIRHATKAHRGSHPSATHTVQVLSYVAEGTLRLQHGTAVAVSAGSFVLIPAGVPHRPTEAQSAELWSAGFCSSCLQLDEGQLLMSSFRNVRLGALPIFVAKKSRRRRIVRLYRDIQAEEERAAAESPELVRSLLVLLLGEVHRLASDSEPPAGAGTLVPDALAFIQRHCLEPISLRDVAAAVNRTAAHVTTTVKFETGYSVGQWINAARVAEAAKRLVHTDESLDDIAGRVGWKDTTHLIRQFRKIHGVTPAAWRRRYRESLVEEDSPDAKGET